MNTPAIFVTREAVMEMVAEVLEHPDIETAWGLYGLISNDGSQVIVTGVLRPSEADVVRQYATTSLGGETQAQAVRWIAANWELMKKQGLNGSSDFSFAFLFKGHSHHGLSFSSYSGTDRRSILEAVEVDKLDVAIGPLATIDADPVIIKPRLRWAGTIAIDQWVRVNLRFYVLTKAMVDGGTKQPILVTPEVIEAKSVPVMPPLGWQFVREDDFIEQVRLLTSYGCNVEILFREIKNGPPYEVQFIVMKPTIWRGILSIVTTWDYPHVAPTFDILNQSSDPSRVQTNYAHADTLLSSNLWENGWDLIEGVFRLEARGEL